MGAVEGVEEIDRKSLIGRRPVIALGSEYVVQKEGPGPQFGWMEWKVARVETERERSGEGWEEGGERGGIWKLDTEQERERESGENGARASGLGDQGAVLVWGGLLVQCWYIL